MYSRWISEQNGFAAASSAPVCEPGADPISVLNFASRHC